MLEELKKQIEKLEQENNEINYFEIPQDNLAGGYPETQKAYDEGYVDGMKKVRAYLEGWESLPNYKPFEIIIKELN